MYPCVLNILHYNFLVHVIKKTKKSKCSITTSESKQHLAHCVGLLINTDSGVFYYYYFPTFSFFFHAILIGYCNISAQLFFFFFFCQCGLNCVYLQLTNTDIWLFLCDVALSGIFALIKVRFYMKEKCSGPERCSAI